MRFTQGPEERGIFGLQDAMREGDLPDFWSMDEALSRPKNIKNRVSVASPVTSLRFRVATFFTLLVLGIFTSRTAYLQLYQGDYYRDVAEANRVRTHAIPSHRGILKDRNGITLAENLPSFRLVAYTSSLPTNIFKRMEIVKPVATHFGLQPEELLAMIQEAGDVEEVLLAEDLDYEKSIAYLANSDDLSGLNVELSERRGYPTNDIPSLSHILGYTGPVNEAEYAELADDGYRKFDVIGKQGVEAAHEKELRGQFGEEVFEVNAKGELLRIISRREPVDGRDLTLTIDARLQAYIELTLGKYLQNRQVKRAAVVAVNPQNGEVLALVSYPAFDANLFAQGISQESYKALVEDPNAPLFPRATAGEYPSGSTIKPLFAAAALTEGVITTQTTFLSVGGVMLGNRFFPDWKPGGHGYTNVYHAIADSVNTFFYIIGGGNESFNGLGLEKLMEYAGKFGLGEKTGIDLTGEADGFLPTKEWKEEVKGEPWYIGDTYNVSIGQGDLLVTPLQMARATAAIANGGLLLSPHMVIGETSEPVRVIEESIANIVRTGMRQTVTAGTARMLQNIPVEAGAKTGTAQWNVNKTPHSWFTGFAPYDNPEITLAVIVEEGGDLNLATPVAKDILDWYFREE